MRTTTALTTVPFFAVPSGEASFTAAVIMSPSPARRPLDPPSGRIICSLRALELSATSNILRIITAMIFELLPAAWAVSHFSPLLTGLFELLLAGDNRGALNHFRQTPALQFRHWTSLYNANHVAGASRVLLIVRVELLGLRDHSFVLRVCLLHDNFDHDGLGHLGGPHIPDLLVAMRIGLPRLTSCCLLSHNQTFSLGVTAAPGCDFRRDTGR